MADSIPKNAVDVFRNRKGFRVLLEYFKGGYLKDIGWYKSYWLKKPVDANDQPIPWTTYSFIDFIADRLTSNMMLVEYGSGNSTLFFSKKVKKVFSVEHDDAWYASMKKAVPENVSLSFIPLEYNGEYSRFSLNTGEKAQVIIVDGRDRVNSIKQSIAALSEDGIIVLDDSERPQYQSAISFLQEHHFKRIDFSGIAPGLFYKKVTSVFYRKNNCLNI